MNHTEGFGSSKFQEFKVSGVGGL